MRLYNHLILILLGTLFISQATMANSDKTWRFKVYLSDQAIGEHTFYVSEKTDQTHVAVNADFDVYFLFVNAYSYEHSNYEVWKNGCLISIQSTTNDNGDELFVKAEKQGQLLSIESNDGGNSETGCVKSFAYWDPSFLKSQRLLNSQTGEIMEVRSEYIGEEEVSIRGTMLIANHHRLHTDKFTIDLWYSDKNEWLALNSTTSNGSVLRYEIQ